MLLNSCDDHQNEIMVNLNGKITKIICNAPIKKSIINDSKVSVIMEDNQIVEIDYPIN